MTQEEFFAKFELVADAPGAVARMRDLILQLAIRGKLVPQDPGDGDSNGTDKHPMSARQSSRNSEILPPSIDWGDQEPWFVIPESWSWVHLGSIGTIVGGGTPRSDNAAYFASEGIPWLTPADLNGHRGKRIYRGRRYLTELGLKESSAQLLPEGSVLFSSRAPIGYVAIAGMKLATNQGFKSCIPFVREMNEYVYWYLKSVASRIDEEAPGTTFREVSGKAVSRIPVALPPLAEQKRIVAKVDELMALCDRLEVQHKERATRHAALARASLTRFADAPTPSNLTFLFHKSYTIAPADLRKAILALAVQGKLVPQEPTDEPAQELLSRICLITRKVAAGERARSARRFRELDATKCAHAIPPSWVWCRFGDLVLSLRYGTSRKCALNLHGGVPVLRIPNIQSGRIDATNLKFTHMPSGEFEELRLQAGDLLLVRSNGSESLVGRSAVASDGDERFAYAGYLVRARLPRDEVSGRFLHIALSTPSVRDQIEKPIRTTSGVKNINTAEISNLVLPLPPVAEQRRIVAKVDQLMALVDQLETQLAVSRAAGAKLLDAIVSELTARGGDVI